MALLPPPLSEAAPTPYDGVFCGELGNGNLEFFGYDEYCVIQGLEVVDSACLNLRDYTLVEMPLSAAGAGETPSCDDRNLFVSGESRWEHNDEREWTRVAIVRFPDWKARMLDKLGVANISIGYSFLHLWYDPQFYADNTDQEATKSRPLYLTELKQPATTLDWAGLQESPGTYINWTTGSNFNPFGSQAPRSWTPSGDASGVFGNAFGGLPGPACGDNGVGQACRFFVLDVGAVFEPENREDFNFFHLDDVMHGARPWDHGFLIADGDFFQDSRESNGEAPDSSPVTGDQIDDRGSCVDPTYVPQPNAEDQRVPGEPAPPAAASTCQHVFRSAGWPGGGDPGRRAECADAWIRGQFGEDGVHIPGTGIEGLSGETDWVCWPRLVVHFSRNEPAVTRGYVAYNQTRSELDRAAAFAFSGKAPANISLEVEDEWGEILSVSYKITTSDTLPNGRSQERVVVPETAIASRRWNGTRDPVELARCRCEKWHYFVQAPLDLDPGRYWVNFTIEDTDHNRIVWPPLRFRPPPNLVVDETVPVVDDVAFRASEFDHKDTLGLTADVRSPRLDQMIENVWAEVYTPGTETAPGTLVKRFKAAPVDGEVNEFRNGKWGFSSAWGRFDLNEAPGPYHLWIRANDTFGRETFGFAGAFRVRDTLDPQIHELRVLAPQTAGEDVYLQESGGPVRIEVEASDPENPAAPTGVVRLVAAGGDPVEHPLVATTPGAFAVQFPAPATGTWDASVVLRDAEGRTATHVFTLVSLAPSPPILRSPSPSGWSNLTPEIRVEVFDPTADPASIRLFVGDPAAGLTERAPVVTGSAPLLVVRAPALGTLRHNRTVEVRVEATDALGLSKNLTWQFRIDAVPPSRTEMEVGSPRDVRAGRTFVVRTTPLVLVGGDGDSGLASLRWRATDVDHNVTSPWFDYAGAFTLGSLDIYRGPARFLVEWAATDRAGNAESVRSRELLVDADSPTLKLRFDGLAFTTDAADPGSGIAAFTIWYRPADQASWNVLEVPIRDAGRVEEKVAVTAIPRGERAYYHALAVDRVGNEVAIGSREEPVEVISPNHPPALDVELPSEGATIAGVQAFKYGAADPDRDPVRIVLTVRPFVLQDPRTLAAVTGDAGTVAWDTGAWPDGAYEIAVLASDGTDSVTVKTRVEVRNTESGAFEPASPKGRVEFTDPVVFEVTLYKPVRDVAVRIADSTGSEAARVVLKDDGTGGDSVAGDHIYSAQFVAARKGTYKPTLEIQYENEPARTQELPAFTVESTLMRALSRNAVPIVLATLVAIGVASAVVVQLVRYGYLFPRE